MPSKYDYTLNINLTTQGSPTLAPNKTGRAIALAIGDVGFKAATNRQRRLKANLHRDFAPVVERELQKMARDISRLAIGISNPNNPPPGQLRITGKVSRYMTGRAGSMSIASMTGVWATRTKAYMKAKVKRYRTRRWFKNTGRLQEQLKSVGTYRSAYGPVSIRFTPRDLRAEASRGRVSSLGRSSGGQSTNIMIGRLEVSPMRRLNLSDLPTLGTEAEYNKRLLSPLANSVERKLTGKPSVGKYRPVIEPFLSYYMTRKIPNAVFLKLENSFLS